MMKQWEEQEHGKWKEEHLTWKNDQFSREGN